MSGEVFLHDHCIALDGESEGFCCTLCIHDGKHPPKDIKSEKELVEHFASDHFPIDWQKYSALSYLPNPSP